MILPNNMRITSDKGENITIRFLFGFWVYSLDRIQDLFIYSIGYPLCRDQIFEVQRSEIFNLKENIPYSVKKAQREIYIQESGEYLF